MPGPLDQLAEILDRLAGAPEPAELPTNAAMMKVLDPMLGDISLLLQIGASVVRSDYAAQRGVGKCRAVVVGHMVRLAKLFEGFRLHVAHRQVELVGVMNRLIFEVEARVSYLMEKGTRQSFKSYILSGYRAEKEMLTDIEAKAAERELSPIEKRMIRSIRTKLMEDGISPERLKANRVWEIDGLNHRAILRSLDRESHYTYTFAGSSRWVHGSWLELRHSHLTRSGALYMAKLEFGRPDVRMAAPVSILCLRVLQRYLDWSKADPDALIGPVAAEIERYLTAMDSAHEANVMGGAGHPVDEEE